MIATPFFHTFKGETSEITFMPTLREHLGDHTVTITNDQNTYNFKLTVQPDPYLCTNNCGSNVNLQVYMGGSSNNILRVSFINPKQLAVGSKIILKLPLWNAAVDDWNRHFI